MLYENLNIPRDRATINAWLRSAATIDPIVNPTIEFHISHIEKSISIIDTNHNKFKEIIPIVKSSLQYIIYDLLVFGESFPYIEIKDKFFTKILDQNIDYVVVKRNLNGAGDMFIIPDEGIKRIFNNNKYEDLLEYKISREVYDSVKTGGNIPLEQKYIKHLKLSRQGTEVRGTSYLVPIFTYIAKQESLNNEEVKNIILFPFENMNKTKISMIRELYNRVWGQINPWLAHCFSLISEENEWYVEKHDKKEPLIPEINFNDPMIFFDH